MPQFPSLVPEFEAQYEAFKKTIPDTVEIIDGGMVTTKEQSSHRNCSVPSQLRVKMHS